MKQFFILGTLAAVLSAAMVNADEKADALARQKAAADANWKKMQFEKPGSPMLETPNLIIYSRLPEAKTKALGASLDKVFATATKALKYDSKDPPWPGKAAVYVLTDREEFVEFMRKSLKKPPREDDASFSNVVGDNAMVVVGAPRVGNHDAEEEARAGLAVLLLKRKLGGADPPDWLASGFVRATSARAARPASKAMSNVPGVSFGELWGDKLDAKSKAVLATPLVDYLAYGPGAGMFGDFVAALRPGEAGDTPSLKMAAEAIKLDEASLELLVRSWKKPPTPKPKKPGK